MTQEFTPSVGGHRVVEPSTWVEVNLDVFDRNLRNVQQFLSNGASLCFIMKADAYGIGVELLMPSVIKGGVTCIGIASNEEAHIVRASGFDKRLIRVRTATLNEIEAALPFEVEELVGSAGHARDIGAVAARNKQEILVHLALNSSGMSRNELELKTDDGRQDAKAIASVPGLRIVGLMTHFAVEDRADIMRDLATFERDCEWVLANTGLKRSELTLHAANTFPALNAPETHLDMVRIGLMVYGLAGPRPEYQTAITFKSRVASVIPYPAGNTVGYGRTYTLQRNSLLANIPVGYANGYRRAFTNKGTVLIRGQRAPVVGAVSMNTLMVDVTDIEGVRSDDEVVLFGKQGDNEITRSEIEEVTSVFIADTYTVWGNSNPKIVRP